jgi:hypothetical protein
MWEWLPEGALVHDELAYMKEVEQEAKSRPAVGS